MDYEILGYIKASKYRRKILFLLRESNLTPIELSKRLNTHISQVTRTLNELIIQDLVKCHTPNLRKGRIFSITEKTNEILEYLEGEV